MWLYPLCFAILALSVAIRLDFQQLHNDFWDVYFIARHMDWADKQTWFNPQYPIGYTFFLKIISGKNLPTIPSILVNIAFGFTVLFASMKFYRRLLTPGFALVSLVLLSFFPQFFHYVTVGGGDPGSLALFTLGTVIILSALYRFPDPHNHGKYGPFLLAGILMGVAALFRYHVLVADGMFVLAVFLVFPRNWKLLAIVSIGVCAAYSPQWIINVVTGHGLLKTQFGPMNVYDLMYGMNWYRITDVKLPSVLHIIASNPALFLNKYLHAFWSFKQAWLPAFFAAAFEKDFRQKKIARAIALWIFIYFLMFSAVTSGRQILLPLPLSFLCFGMSLRILWNRMAQVPIFSRIPVRAMFGTVVLILIMSVSLRRDAGVLSQQAAEENVCKSIESYLKQRDCTNPKQVFTSDYDFYFRTLPTFIPYFNGGSSRLGMYLYNEEFVEFPVDSQEAFVAACRNRGVRYVVLNADSHLLSDTLGAVYDGYIDLKGLELETQIKGEKIYRVI